MTSRHTRSLRGLPLGALSAALPALPGLDALAGGNDQTVSVRAGVLKDTGEKQTPWETSSLMGDFCFRTGGSGECPAAAFAR